MKGVRIHTYDAAPYRLWADRVPVMHGRANLYTLWRKDRDGWKRLIGGVRIHELRRFIGGLSA